jgi:hypothetical protein
VKKTVILCITSLCDSHEDFGTASIDLVLDVLQATLVCTIEHAMMIAITDGFEAVTTAAGLQTNKWRNWRQAGDCLPWPADQCLLPHVKEGMIHSQSLGLKLHGC